MSRHRTGPAIAGKHTSNIEAADDALDALEKIEGLRMTLGIMKRVRGNGKRKVLFKNTRSGFKMKITGNRYVQTFYVITNNRKEAISAVHAVFNAE